MIRGSCLCKGYRFEVHGEFSDMSDCYCSMCRKAHGAAFATFAGCAAADFKLLAGSDLVRGFKSSEQGVRNFCSVCGSNLPMSFGDKVYVPAGLLDDDPVVRTGAHMFVGSKAPWIEINDDVKQFDGYPT